MARRPPPRVPGPPPNPNGPNSDPNNPDPKPITAGELDAMGEEEKVAVLAASLAQVVNSPMFAEKLRDERILGYTAAEADGRPWTDIVVVLAHNDEYELFFKDHAKLNDGERAYMIELLSIEDTVAYEALSGVAKYKFERDWATTHWRWKRHAEKFFPGGVVGWNAHWIYRSDLEDDPIYEHTKHPMHPAFMDAADIAEDGYVKFLILGGNAAMAQKCIVPPEVADKIVESAVMVPMTVGPLTQESGPERVID